MYTGKVAVDITRMARDEQLELLEELKEHLGRVAEGPPLTEAQRQELDRALDR